MFRLRQIAAVVVTLALAADTASAQRKKKKKGAEEEEITQTLEVVQDPPLYVKADTQRLTFHTAPLSGKGLLSQQVRDGLKALLSLVKRAQIVKIRAFVAGSGDQRRVQAIVSELFTEKRLNIPALSVVQVGALPHEGAQVLLESISVDRKQVNPHGLAWFSGQQVRAGQMTPKVAPLVTQSVASLRKAFDAAQVKPEDALRVTCFLSSIDDINEVRPIVMREFPRAAHSLMQVQRAMVNGLVECEAVARLSAPPGAPLKLLNPDGLVKSEAYSQIALVGAPQVVLTSAQMAFRAEEKDVRLAFDRLGKVLESAGTSYKNVAFTHVYPLYTAIANRVRAIRFDYLDKSRPPASTLLMFEGLPSLDASFAVEVVAIQ